MKIGHFDSRVAVVLVSIGLAVFLHGTSVYRLTSNFCGWRVPCSITRYRDVLCVKSIECLYCIMAQIQPQAIKAKDGFPARNEKLWLHDIAQSSSRLPIYIDPQTFTESSL